MKNILVPIGTSENNISHLNYAIDLATTLNAKLHLVQTYDVQTKAGTLRRVQDILKRESIKYLKELVANVDTKGVEIAVYAFKGELVKTLEIAAEALSIDLLVMEPRTNSVKNSIWLDKTSGKVIKRTEVPTLIVPEGYKFAPMKSVLFGLKNAKIRKDRILYPLQQLKGLFSSKVNLVLVKTEFYKDGHFALNQEMEELIDSQVETENATTFQGIIEHYQSIKPDLICVVRRKRGVFTKFLEKDTIKKKDFYSSVPVLVLSGIR